MARFTNRTKRDMFWGTTQADSGTYYILSSLGAFGGWHGHFPDILGNVTSPRDTMLVQRSVNYNFRQTVTVTDQAQHTTKISP